MFPIFYFPHIWICGHAETVPRHISRFQFLHFEKSIFLKHVEHVGYIFLEICVFHRFQSLPALCVCVAAACGASATSEKTRPWNFGVCILRILSFLTISGPPKPFAAVSQLPAALRLPQKNTPLDFWSMYLVDFVIF